MTRAPSLHLPTPAGYRTWVAWQCALELCVACHHLADRLPPPRRRGLGDPLRRAADVVPTCVALAHDALHRDAAARRLQSARGALRAVETRLAVAGRLCPDEAGAAAALERRCRATDRLLSREIRGLCGHAGAAAPAAAVTRRAGRASQRTPTGAAATLKGPNTPPGPGM